MEALLVGSQEAVSKPIRRLLEKENLDVSQQPKDRDLFAVVGRTHPHLIVLIEPGQRLLQGCGRIRRAKRTQPVIVAVCQSLCPENLEKLWTAGVDECISSDRLDSGELLSRIQWLRIRAAHERLEADFRSLFEASPSGMVITTPTGKLLTVNDALLDISGYSQEELRTTNVLELYANPSRRTQFRKRIESEGQVHDFEVDLRRKDGSVRVCLLNAGLRRDLDGRPVTYQTIVQDITEKRMMERDLMRISEEERRRIGRDLHDGPASSLSGLEMVLHGLTRRIQKGQSIDPEELQKVAEIIRRESTETRMLAHGLDPVELEQGDLFEAIETLCRNVRFVHDTACHLQSPRQLPDLPNDTALHIYRMIQEATSNAARHGKPDNIWIRLEPEENLLRATIEDDGSGLEHEIDEDDNLRLRTIRYRIQLLGGDVQISSTAGSGTTLRCDIPLPST